MSTAEIIEKKDFECPNCKTHTDIEIRKKPTKVIMEEQETQKTVKETVHEHKHEEPKPDPHDEIAKMMPKGVNFGKCANGNCGTKIKNAKGITTKFKACPNCRTNTVPKSSDFCPTCGKDNEEWDESDVEIEDEDGD